MIAPREKVTFNPGNSLELLVEDLRGFAHSPRPELLEGDRAAEGERATEARLKREVSLRRMLLDPMVRLAKKLGIYITRDPGWLVYQDHIARLLSTFKINCVLDVGAHHGDFAKWLRRIGYVGLIISFEPVAANYQILEETRADDAEWRTHRLALGSTRGHSEISVFNGTTFHSFYAPSEYGRAAFPDKLKVERKELVAIERLDNILDQLTKGIEQPRIFMKVDTQGYDLEVIRGLGAKAAQIRALQMEMSVTPIYEQATNSFIDAMSYLQENGFQLSGIFPVSYDKDDNVRLVEFDCVVCRQAPPENRGT